MSPELLNELQRFRNEMAHGMAPVDPTFFRDRLEALGVTMSSERLRELIPRIIQIFGGSHTGYYSLPSALSEVIIKLLQNSSAKILCDPWAGLGMTLAVARCATSAPRCIAFNVNSVEFELAKNLFPQAEWTAGNPLQLLKELKESVDVFVSCLPFGARTSETLILEDTEGKPIELRDDLGNLILAAATARLSPNGIGIFVVPSSFFSERSILNRFKELGFSIDGALALPPGIFSPYTNISTYLLIVVKSPMKPMFVAQLSGDLNANAQILENFSSGKQDGVVEFGRFVNAVDFRGIDSLRAEEYFESASKLTGCPAITLEELAAAINLGRPAGNFKFPEVPNSIFVPMVGHGAVVTSIEEFTIKPQNYAQIAVEPSQSYAIFVAQSLNSELGKRIREWGMSGTTFLRLNKKTLGKLKIFIPELATQKKMMDIESELSSEENTLLSLQNDLAELRRELWGNPQAAEVVSGRLAEFSSRITGKLKDQASLSLEQWAETIPFPLASILRMWQTTPSSDYKAKYEHLLQFFEATAEFIGVILLSAFSVNEAIYEPHKVKLKEVMIKQGLSFERATFGVWKMVVEYFGKQVRSLLQEKGKKPQDSKNDLAICASIFADSTLQLPKLLSSAEIADILSITNKMRNDWTGHGGVVGSDEAKLRNEKLLGQVERLRKVMADLWDKAMVVSSLFCKPRKSVFENEIEVMKGSNSEFLKEMRSMSAWLDTDSIYVISKDQRSALKLLPLIQVSRPQGVAKSACYFFNRIESRGVRLVSYHFTGKPEIVDTFQDVIDAIKFLT